MGETELGSCPIQSWDGGPGGLLGGLGHVCGRNGRSLTKGKMLVAEAFRAGEAGGEEGLRRSRTLRKPACWAELAEGAPPPPQCGLTGLQEDGGGGGRVSRGRDAGTGLYSGET